jgi:hypothetical protein
MTNGESTAQCRQMEAVAECCWTAFVLKPALQPFQTRGSRWEHSTSDIRVIYFPWLCDSIWFITHHCGGHCRLRGVCLIYTTLLGIGSISIVRVTERERTLLSWARQKDLVSITGPWSRAQSIIYYILISYVFQKIFRSLSHNCKGTCIKGMHNNWERRTSQKHRPTQETRDKECVWNEGTTRWMISIYIF